MNHLHGVNPTKLICSKNIAFIINPSEEVKPFTSLNAYAPENENNELLHNLIVWNSSVAKHFKQNGGGAAIPVGIPSSCFSGICIGDELLQNEDAIQNLIKLFPHCYIASRIGEILYMPTIYKLSELGSAIISPTEALKSALQETSATKTDEAKGVEQLTLKLENTKKGEEIDD